MSEEKKIFYKTLNNIVATNRIDNEETYIINNYVSELENIIKKVREYIIQYGNLYCLKHKQFKDYHQYKVILEILDKENKNERAI